MNLLTTINKVPNRVWRAQWAAIGFAALVFLSGLTLTAHAQTGSGGGAGKVSYSDIFFASSVGVARDQMLRMTVPIPNSPGAPNGRMYLGTSVGVFICHVRFFNALTGAEIRSFELRNPTPGIHTFDIGGDGDDLLLGGLGGDVSRLQLLIQVRFAVVRSKPTAKEADESIFPPTIEVVDKLSGRTTVHGTAIKVGVQNIWDPVL